MKVFYRDEQTAKHNSSFSPSAGKPGKALDSWKKLGSPVETVIFAPATREQLYKVHDQKYVDGVLDLKCSNGFGNRLPEVAEVLPYVAGSMVAATLHTFKTGETAFSPTSGAHHACFDHGGGYCTFNFLALAAVEVYEAGAKKVAIIDCDRHGGNGTVDIIHKLGLHFIKHYSFGYDHSIHDKELWKSQFPAKVRNILKDADVLIYNAGADPHIDDPLGGFLTTEELKERDDIVLGIAHEFQVPVAISLAGGYQDPLRKVLDIHDNTYLVAKKYANEVRSSNSRVSADNYGADPYRRGYSDALKKVLTIIRECNEQEWCLETSSVNAVLVDAIQTEMSDSRAQLLQRL